MGDNWWPNLQYCIQNTIDSLYTVPSHAPPACRQHQTMAQAAALEEDAELSQEELSKEELEDVMAADWSRMQAGLRERRAASGGRAQGKDEDDEDDDDLDEDDPRHTRRCAPTSTALSARVSHPGRSRVAGGACAPRRTKA